MMIRLVFESPRYGTYAVTHVAMVMAAPAPESFSVGRYFGIVSGASVPPDLLRIQSEFTLYTDWRLTVDDGETLYEFESVYFMAHVDRESGDIANCRIDFASRTGASVKLHGPDEARASRRSD